jgi:hypothetical protein
MPNGLGLIDDESSAMLATRNGGLVEGFGGIGGKRILTNKSDEPSYAHSERARVLGFREICDQSNLFRRATLD